MKALSLAGLLLYSGAALAAPLDVGGLITLLIWIVVIGLVFWLIWWFLGTAGLPEPFNKVAHVIVALVAFIVVLYLVLGILPPFPR